MVMNVVGGFVVESIVGEEIFEIKMYFWESGEGKKKQRERNKVEYSN